MRKLLPLLVAFAISITSAYGQCPSGYTSAGLNWDALEYFPTGGYTGFSSSTTMSPNQSFAFGKNRLTITYSGVTSAGENGTHTYVSGDDVQYKGDGTVTLTFASEVANLKFSVYDIDMIQKLQISAVNSANVPQNVSVTTLGTTILTVTGNNTANVQVADNTSSTSGKTTTYGTVVASNSGNASISVDITGPVKTVTLISSSTGTVTSGSAASQEDGSFWLSSISACINVGSFPTNYYAVSKPSNGIPGYVLVSANKGVYAVNTATGFAKLIFEDGASSGTINSVAYDPYNRIIYYTWSLTNMGSANASERTLRKYDMNTGTVSKVVDDINSIGLPTFDQGIESGAAAFYDGALYLGVEGGADNGNGGPKTSTTTGRESIIWRIDFNSSGAPTSITQVYAVSGDTHDWSDFSINDGILYDFNGDAATPDYHHLNLQTGANQLVTPVVGPKQSAVGWDGTIYWVNNKIGPYSNGNVGTQVSIYSNPAIPNWGTSTSPSFGDAGEAFKPQADFGDAPNTYDPVTPAVHETISNLKLGSNVDLEWDKPAILSGNATEDGSDEDGLAYASILVQGSNYVTDLKVLNNTGANATVCAWIDLNNDGQFQSTEGITQSVPTSTTTQTLSLVWTNPVSSIPNNSYTYLRIRITSSSNGMTTSNPTGYFSDGEVEDYRVFVSNTPLEVKLTDFSARKLSEEKVRLTWSVTDEEPGIKYEVEKSSDNHGWVVINSRIIQAKNASSAYESLDATPYAGTNYYRLKITKPDGTFVYSAIKKILFEKPVTVQITPNPASANARLSVQVSQRASAHISIADMSGRFVYQRVVAVEEGSNAFTLPVQQLPAGIYQAEVWIDSRRYSQQLIVRK